MDKQRLNGYWKVGYSQDNQAGSAGPYLPSLNEELEAYTFEAIGQTVVQRFIRGDGITPIESVTTFHHMQIENGVELLWAYFPVCEVCANDSDQIKRLEISVLPAPSDFEEPLVIDHYLIFSNDESYDKALRDQLQTRMDPMVIEALYQQAISFVPNKNQKMMLPAWQWVDNRRTL